MHRLDEEIVAANVKRFIQENGYSKQSFAKKLGIPRFTLDQLLAGEMKTEQLHKYVQKMATVFQCTPAYLLTLCPQQTETISFSNQLQQLKEQNPKNQQLLSDLEDVLDIAALYL